MPRPVKPRRLTQDEGTYLLRLVRRGRADTLRYRVMLYSARSEKSRWLVSTRPREPSRVRRRGWP